MKKILLTAILSVFYVTSVSAEIGVNIGLAGHLGVFTGTGTETHTDTTSATSATKKNSDTEIAAVGYSSIFIEKTLGEFLTVGVDYVPQGIGSDTVESTKIDEADGHLTNTVAIDFEDLTTYYLAFNIGDAYIKAGMMEVDVITKEKLGTGSSYGNTSLDGTLFGVGYNKSFENTMFVRIETNYMQFDSVEMKSLDNRIKLNSLDGVTGKLSLGKSF